MLRAPAEFPHAGSFTLFVDTNLPPAQQRAELARVMRWGELSAGGREAGDEGVIALPLRVGASGTRYVRRSDLIDGTPLTKAEERELADLERNLRGRERLTAKLKADKARADVLKGRLIFSQVLTAELAKLERLEARAQPSVGGRLPREMAA